MRFILVDKILALEPGLSITTQKTLEPSEELFRDHFPGFPVVPGVLLVEMMAQSAGKCLNAERRSRGLAMLLQIRNAVFRHWVLPGETITIRVSIESNTDTVASAKATTEVAGRAVASCELLLTFVPRSSLAADYRDEILEAYLASVPGSQADGK